MMQDYEEKVENVPNRKNKYNSMNSSVERSHRKELESSYRQNHVTFKMAPQQSQTEVSEKSGHGQVEEPKILPF